VIMVIRLVLEHHSPKLYDNLRSELEDCYKKIAVLERNINSLETQYGAEVSYNAALCDLLKAHGIPFRQVFSHRVRYKNGP